MRVYHRRGRLIGESQERVARANSLPGDVGVSPTTKIPLLLINGSLLMKSTLGIALITALWTCETSDQEKGAKGMRSTKSCGVGNHPLTAY